MHEVKVPHYPQRKSIPTAFAHQRLLAAATKKLKISVEVSTQVCGDWGDDIVPKDLKNRKLQRCQRVEAYSLILFPYYRVPCHSVCYGDICIGQDGVCDIKKLSDSMKWDS